MKRRMLFPHILFTTLLTFLVFSFASLAFSATASAATINAGFVNGVWYSKYPFYADDLVNIYSAIQNRSDTDLSGKVGFYIDDILIGESTVKIAKSTVGIASIQWKATTGSRAIHAKIEELKTPDGTVVSSDLIATQTDANSVKIEVDPQVVKAAEARQAAIDAQARAADRARASSTLAATLGELDTTKPIAPLLQNTENSLLTAANKLSVEADAQAKKAAQFLLDQKKNTDATVDAAGNGNKSDTNTASAANSLSGASRLLSSAYNGLLDVSATALIFWKLVLAVILVVLLIFKARSWAKRKDDSFSQY